jgi:hypothetical protein
MLKENIELLNKNLSFERLNNAEITTCIELAYILREYANDELLELNDTIRNYSNDGIYTFGLFVLFCYNEYCKGRYWDIYEFLNCEIKKCTENFIKRYFEEKEN